MISEPRHGVSRRDALYRLLEPYYRRKEEDRRALLREAFRASGTLELDVGHLEFTLEHLSAQAHSGPARAWARSLARRSRI